MSENPARMRLLVVISNLEIGGAERQMTLLVKGLSREKYEVSLACCRLQGPLVQEVPEHVRLYDLGKRSRWDFPLLVVRLRRILQEFQPEFVIASMEYSALVAWLANSCRRRRARVIARKEVMASQARLGEAFRRTKNRLDAWVTRRVDMIIAPSLGILDELRGDLAGTAIPMVQIPNVVDLDRVRLAERPPAANGILAMGRFVAWKRFDLLLRAVGLLPRGSVELHLVGDGPERPSLERLARELGIEGQTRFHGYLVDPFPVLQKACIGVLPSQFEPFGNVIVEMFAAGLPVVAFDVDYGPREIIREGENGLLVSPLEPRALAQALSSLLADGDLRSRMGTKARQEVERRYALVGAVRAYEECFSLLRGHLHASVPVAV